MTAVQTSTAYQAVLDGAAFMDESTFGRIRMRGESALDLLQRLSSNDVLRLRPGQGTRTVLTSPIGRIIDLLTVYRLADSVLVITGAERGPLVFGHLRKNIFFNDKVTLEALGGSHAQFTLYGPTAAMLLADLAGVVVADLPLNNSVQATLAGAEITVARVLPIGGAGFRLLVPAEHADVVRAALAEAGAATVDAATFDMLRVEQGYAAVGNELSAEYIPLETGLSDAISFTKGCYVGQEIIARMESRGRLAKQLRGLRLSGDTAALALPAKLAVDGKEAGDLTSIAHSPRFGPIALAYVRSAHADAGTHVAIGDTGVTGEVVALPFGGERGTAEKF